MLFIQLNRLIVVFLIYFSLLSERVLAQSSQPVFYSPQAEHWADSLMKTMTSDQRIGQLFMVAAWSNKDSSHVKSIDSLITDCGIGGIIFFQGGPIREALLTNHYQQISKIPLLIGIDGEWGLAMRLDSTIRFPRQMTLSAMNDDYLITEMGNEIARQCKRIGIHTNFSPDADINNNILNPVIGSRSFGDDREMVTKNSLLYMNSLQKNHILATGKHFPGHGNTDSDSHLTLPTVRTDSAAMDTVELYPFKKLIQAGVGGMMVAHLNVPALDTVPNEPSTLSKKIVTGILKNKLGFNGLVFTDALNMKGVSTCFMPGVLDKMALLSGNDVLLYSEDVRKGLEQIHLAVVNGEFTQQEIDQRVKKILMLKYWVGLKYYYPIDTTNLYADLNTPHAEFLQQKLYEKAITVLLNKDSVIPFHFGDSLKIASVVVGDKKMNSFQKQLLDYYPVDLFSLENHPSSNEFHLIETHLQNYDLIILSLHNTTMKAEKNFGMSEHERQFVEDVMSKHRCVFVDFGNAYTLSEFKNLEKSKVVVMAYEDMPVMQELAAQLLFGGLQSNGILPVNSQSSFEKYSGLNTSSPTRFKYTFPEGAGMDDRVLSRIDSIATNAIVQKAIPGCEVLVAKDQKVVYYKVFGHPTYDDTTAVTKEDLYDIASVTKVAGTALATMKLYDQGKIDLDKPLSKYLPKLKKSNKKSLIIRDVLAHQAGLQSWIPFWKQTVSSTGKLNTKIYHTSPSADYSIRVADSIYMKNTYRDSIFKWILNSPVGEKGKYFYSDLGPILMKMVIEKITGKTLDQYLEENFYKPMGLQRITFQPRKKFELKEIIPTEDDKEFRKQLVHGDVHDPAAAMMGGVSGNAGLFANANDLAVVMQMLLNKGSYGGKQYIQSGTVDIFTLQQFKGNRRGLFFDKPDPDSTKSSPTCKSASLLSFGHQGFTGTCAWVDPEYHLVYIFLSNRVNPDATNEKLVKLNVRTEIQQVIYDSFLKK